MLGVIVDGIGDHAAFRERYGSRIRVMKADGPRGHMVTPEALASSCKKQIELLRAYGCSSVAVITDYEGRAGNIDSFCGQLNKLFAGYALKIAVVAYCADRMIENWILADVSYLASKKKYLRSVKQRCFESTNGKVELKKLFQHGHDYNEVRHGAELFSLIRAPYAVKQSASFKKLQEGTKLG